VKKLIYLQVFRTDMNNKLAYAFLFELIIITVTLPSSFTASEAAKEKSNHSSSEKITDNVSQNKRETIKSQPLPNEIPPPDEVSPQSNTNSPPNEVSPHSNRNNENGHHNNHHSDNNPQISKGSAQPTVPYAASQSTSTTQKKGCLIATAAFGSELTPQVQFLRNFRDYHIMSTTAGSSFMNAFNTWYYSFSPFVADYESSHTWLQQVVKSSIYPLLGVLTISENAYHVGNGEIGAVFAGIVASSLIGSIYFSPFALLIKKIRKSDQLSKTFIVLLFMIITATAITSLITKNNFILTISTSTLVLTTIIVSSIITANTIAIFAKVIKSTILKYYQQN
jgi:hypothetical protein